MRKIIITGGPSTGKSTIFGKMRAEYPKAFFVPEAAELVISQELAKQAADPSYVPKMPVTHYNEFSSLVIAQQLKSETAIPSDSHLIILDRSLLDNEAYLRHNDLPHGSSETLRNIDVARYSLVFICDWLGKFEATAIRRETPEQGLAIHDLLVKVYCGSGLRVVHLPPVSVEERLVIIRETLAKIETAD